MASRVYERLPIEEFGRQLINSGDLDPVYIALYKMKMDKGQKARWLLVYWCYYHCGAACHISERSGPAFWQLLMEAALNENPTPLGGRWPRGHERRHARGAQGVAMVADLRAKLDGDPEAMVELLLKKCTGGVDFALPANLVKQFRLFGPWIAFKVCDMLERLYQAPISFDNADVFMFKDPREAALMLWRQRFSLPPNARPKDPAGTIRQVVEMLAVEFQDQTAPPDHTRRVGLQEIETVLCKWKSHMNGHYPLYNDIDEIRAGLVGWGSTAEAFAKCMPGGVAGSGETVRSIEAFAKCMPGGFDV